MGNGKPVGGKTSDNDDLDEQHDAQEVVAVNDVILDPHPQPCSFQRPMGESYTVEDPPAVECAVMDLTGLQ